MKVSCPECGSEEVIFIRPGVFGCGHCEYSFSADEIDFDEERFKQLEARIEEIELRLLKLERNGIDHEENDYE